MPLPQLPTIPGREVAGVVDRLGAGVSREWLGARVVSHLGLVPGGYASQAVTATTTLFRLPDHVSFTDAVAMVGTGRTAQGVLELFPPRPHDVVLVPSAAGGLGWLLVQAAHEVGARVVAAAGGGEKVDRLAELKPELAVDYNEPDWPDRVRAAVGAATVAYDGVGGTVGRTALELLGSGGRLVMFGHSAGAPTAFDSGDVVSRALTVSWGLGPAMMARPGGIAGLARRSLDRLGEGSWRPLVTTYPLADAAHAHADLEDRATYGKVVLVP
jgi:NADPH2:quinone reductase